MKRFLSISVVLLSLANCTSSTDCCVPPPHGERKMALVTAGDLPATIKVNDVVSIAISVSGPTTCWSDLQAEMLTLDSNHLLILGSGFDSEQEACATSIVNHNTTLSFKPKTPGKYYFQINEQPLIVKYDSILVEE